MARETKLTEKDMSVLREGAKAKDQRESRHASIRDYSLHHRVTISWDLNEDAIKDQMFRMTIDDKVVILDAEEVMRQLRWV